MNNMEVNTEEQLPSHYEIAVRTFYEVLSYNEVAAFQIENQMLQLMQGRTTHIIPLYKDVVEVQITPVYPEETLIVQVP